MRGRDPHEAHRVSTPLELLFDLTFVIAYASAASQLAHMLAAGHVGAGIAGFTFACFAIAWAWINFAWFASAYDVDDWGYRLLTMLQMVGVLILALGLPAMFASFEHEDADNRVMVLGYVVMRVPMIAQWVRAGRQDPARRASSRIYVGSILVSQIVWCILVLFEIRVGTFFLLASAPLALELAGPFIAERKHGGTPWHPHHIAERYSLVVIIALGEAIAGTMATLAAIIGPEGPGWSIDVAVVGLAGTALTFGMWWIYFVIPSGEMLAAYPERSFAWGYGHILVFASIVAVGAGLHVAAFSIEHHTALSLPGTLLCTGIPLAIYTAMILALYSSVTRSVDPCHKWMALGSAVPIAASVVLACTGVGLAWCVAVLALSPWAMVVGYELVGHHYTESVIREARSRDQAGR